MTSFKRTKILPIAKAVIIIFLLNFKEFCFGFKARGCPFARKNVLPLHVQNVGDLCQPPPLSKPCDFHSPYYTYDGSCNNIKFPTWGQAGTPYIRMAPANYSDGFCSFRKGTNGKQLPLARKIRTTLFTDKEVPSNVFNIMYYAFAQLVSHDASQLMELPDKKCCNGKEPATDADPDLCMHTIVPKDDPFYSKHNVTCIDMTRVVNTKMLGCKVSPCLPINYQTPVLDLSILYGTSEEIVKRIRTLINGELKYANIEETDGEESLFGSVEGEELCPKGGLERGTGKPCMDTGDHRVNQNPELTLMDIIFMRAHNYIARNLLKINPSWDDERTFQEARRLLIAIYQHIVMIEQVPAMLGSASSANYALLPPRKGYNLQYNDLVNQQTTTEYTFAAGRAHHSMIKGNVKYVDSEGKNTSYNLRDRFYNQRFLYSKGVFSNLLWSFLNERSNTQTQHYAEEITNFLLTAPGDAYGMDLISYDIDRGLDAGLPTYNAMRQACGLCKLNTFEDLADEIQEPTDISKLKKLYSSIDDVDLYVGGLLEKPVKGSMAGPTFTCIIGENFYRWKFGDRLYFEFPAAQFSLAQIDEIRRASFAWLLCRADTKLKYVPKNPFLTPSNDNPLVRCEKIEDIDFSEFKANRTANYEL